MKSYSKEKLKKRGNLYFKYFYNSDEVIKKIVEEYDLKKPIDESNCKTVFDVDEKYKEKIYELILYYPNKLKEIKYITNNIIDELYNTYGETINIMKESKNNNENVRGRLCGNAKDRCKETNIICDINSEDIILVRKCPYLDVFLDYGGDMQNDNTPSLDRIIPSLGYVKGNIQVISMLSNKMKNSATIEQLITFSNNVLKLHKK